VDLDDGLHVGTGALDARGPAVESAGTLGTLEVGLVANYHGEAAESTFAVDRSVDLALPRVETEGLADRSELRLLSLGELGRETSGVEVVENDLLRDLGEWLTARGRRRRMIAGR
jgi:hypothetical protein